MTYLQAKHPLNQRTIYSLIYFVICNKSVCYK